MFTQYGFQDKYSNQMDQGNFYHNRFLKLECTASFQLTAEVQTPSAEQAHGCKIHIWKYFDPVSAMENSHTLTTYKMTTVWKLLDSRIKT